MILSTHGKLISKLCSIIARLIMKNQVTFTFQQKNWESFTSMSSNTTGYLRVEKLELDD
jgi:hypothetical protein